MCPWMGIIKRDGFNFPDFFLVYFDILVKLLRKKGVGCPISKLFVAFKFFADDICLLALDQRFKN